MDAPIPMLCTMVSGMLQSSFWHMSAIVEELKAVVGLLDGCPGSQRDALAAAHAESIIAKLSGLRFSVAELSAVLKVVEGVQWPGDCKERVYKAAIDCTSTPKHVKNQTFLHLPQYMTEPLVRALEAPSHFKAKISYLVQFLLALGVRAPTERSVQSIVGTLVVVSNGFEATQSQEPSYLLSLVVEFKSMLHAALKHRPDVVASVSVYPASPHELRKSHPALWDACYSETPPMVYTMVDVVLLDAFISTVPLRKTHRCIKPVQQAQARQPGMQDMFQLLQVMAQRFQQANPPRAAAAVHASLALSLSFLPTPSAEL